MNRVTSLANLCTFIVDCEHKTTPIDEAGNHFAVGTPAMRGNVIDYKEARRISRATFESWTRRLRPRSGDLLFAREAPVGPIVMIPESENIAPGQRTVLLRPNAELADSKFLYYLLSSPLQQELIARKAAGSTVAHLNVADIRNFPLSVPTLAAQQAIAEVLGALDDKIAANTKLITTAGELSRFLTRHAVDPGIRGSLSDVAKVTMGSSPVGSSFNEAGDGIVFYQGVRDFGVRFPKNRVWTTSPVRFANANDSLLSVRAPVGRVNMAREETCIGRGLASVRSRDGRPYTLFHLLRNDPQIWEPFEAEGTVFGSINRNQLESIKVPKVDPDQADQLEVQLAALEAHIASALTENVTLAATRDALLPQLMSGTLRVKDAERVIEDIQ